MCTEKFGSQTGSDTHSTNAASNNNISRRSSNYGLIDMTTDFN
jgi:hypothetical protein